MIWCEKTVHWLLTLGFSACIANRLTHVHPSSTTIHIVLCFVFPPADDMEAIPVKHFVKHIMELYKNNLQGFTEEFEVLSTLH